MSPGERNRPRRIDAYVRNLRLFRPELREHFLCPTCLQVIPLSDTFGISRAHIVPKAAGGRTTTFLCTSCNSFFGRYQDKWLGEYLRLQGLSAADKMRKAKKYSRFTVDGFQVEGRWEIGERDNEIFLYIDTARNPPQVVDRLKRQSTSSQRTTSVELRCQIDDHHRLVSVGFLTAAYLLWFSRLGYSWVLQEHLDSFRGALLNPTERIIVPYCGEIKDRDTTRPAVGLVKLDQHYLPAAAMGDMIVLFPSKQAQGVLHRYPIRGSLQITDVLNFEPDFTSHPDYICGIMVDDYVSVMPESMAAPGEGVRPFWYHIDSESRSVRRLVPISDEDWQEASKRTDVKVAKVKLRRETTRPVQEPRQNTSE